MKKFKVALLLSALTLGSVLVSCSNEGHILQPGNKNIVNISIVEGTIPEEIIIGEFDEAGIQILVTYSDDTSDTVTVTSEMVPEFYKPYLTKAGRHEIVVLYREKEVKITVTMIDYLKVNFYTIGEDEEYHLFSTDYFKYGTTILTPEIPLEVYSATKHFTFTGWDKDLENIKKHTDLYAQYASLNYYNVNFYKADGTLISSQKVDENTNAIEPSEENRTLVGYDFIGWDRSYLNVKKDLNIYGLYIKIETNYRLIVTNSDETLGTVTSIGGYYSVNEEVVLSCNLLNENYIYYWEDDNGNFLGKNNFTFKMKNESVKIFCRYSEITDIQVEDNSFYYGSYPQSLVEDSTIRNQLYTMAGSNLESGYDGRKSYEKYFSSVKTDNMLYKDVVLNNEKYRILYIKNNRLSSAQDQTGVSCQNINGYFSGSITYFKFEPVKWKILEEDENHYLAICDLIVDAGELNKSYLNYNLDDKLIYANNWNYSTCKNEELNNKILNWMFSYGEQENILDSYCDSNSNRLFNENDEEISKSKLFLASIDEGIQYNLSENLSYTEYAVSQGLNKNNIAWWSRTEDHDKTVGENHSYCRIFLNDSTNTQWVTDTEYGIRPMANFKK